MKRIIKVLILVLVAIPFTVKANSGPPTIGCYDVNTYMEQTPTYKYDSTNKKMVQTDQFFQKDVEKGICGEKIVDNELYLSIVEDDRDIYFKRSDVFIKGESDVKPYNEPTEPVYDYVLDDGLYLYRGPSYAYDKVSDTPIPKNSVIRVLGDDGGDGAFTYVEYNGQRGWALTAYNSMELYGEKAKVAYGDTSWSIFTIVESVKLYKTPYDSNDYLTMNSPLGKEFKVKYEFRDENGYSRYLGVEHNNELRWIDRENMETEFTSPMNGIAVEPIDYYSDKELKNKAGTLSDFKKYTILYVYVYESFRIGYIRVDGTLYYVNPNKVYDKLYKEPTCGYFISVDPKGINYYKDSTKSELVGTMNVFDSYKVVADAVSVYTKSFVIEKDNERYFVPVDNSYYGYYSYEADYNMPRKTITTKSIDLYYEYPDFQFFFKGKYSVIPSGSEIIILDSIYIKESDLTLDIIKYNDQIGLAVYDYYAYGDKTDLDYCINDPSIKVSDKEEEKTETTSNVDNKKTIIIICAVAGGVVSVTAIVVIILVNKKKKKAKKVEKVEEVKQENVMTENDLNLVKEAVKEEKPETPTEESLAEETPVEEQTEENNKEDVE